MSPNPFGTPAAAPTSPASTTNPGVTNGVDASAFALNQVQEIVDPNDPRLTSEDTTVNVTGDAYAVPSPLTDGRWRARLSDEGVKLENGQTVPDVAKMTKGATKVPYLMTTIKATVISPEHPEFDGLDVFDSWVSTFVGRDGSTKIATILARLKRPDGSPWVTPQTKLTPRGWMDLFHKALAGNPEVIIETQWELNCQKCDEAAEQAGRKRPRALQGMTNFPRETDPVKVKSGHAFKPDVVCAVPGHGVNRARPRIAGIQAVK